MTQERKAYVITNPMIAANRSAEVTLSKFLRVIKPSFDNVTVIGGNLNIEPDLTDIKLESFYINRSENKVKRMVDILSVQLQMRATVKRLIKVDDTVFFWIGDKMILPFRAVKNKGAEVNYFIMGNVAKENNIGIFARMSSLLTRFMAEHATFICTESKSVLEEWPGLKVDKLRLIHLYTDNMEINPFVVRENVIGMVCRLTAGKHVLESIQAMAQIHETNPGWRLEIIGSGRQQEECEKLIAELHAGEYINLLGWVDHDEIIEKTKKWKYLLFPTDTEGMPNGVLEMMGRGIPAIASPVGGIPDLLENGINGVVLAGTSVMAIKDGLTKALKAANYTEMSTIAFNTVYKRYSLDRAKYDAMEVLNCW